MDDKCISNTYDGTDRDMDEGNKDKDDDDDDNEEKDKEEDETPRSDLICWRAVCNVETMLAIGIFVLCVEPCDVSKMVDDKYEAGAIRDVFFWYQGCKRRDKWF